MCYGIQWGRYIWDLDDDDLTLSMDRWLGLGTSFFSFFLQPDTSLIRMIHPDLWVFQGEHLQNWDPHWPPGALHCRIRRLSKFGGEQRTCGTVSHQLSVEKLWIMSSTIVFSESWSYMSIYEHIWTIVFNYILLFSWHFLAYVHFSGSLGISNKMLHSIFWLFWKTCLIPKQALTYRQILKPLQEVSIYEINS